MNIYEMINYFIILYVLWIIRRMLIVIDNTMVVFLLLLSLFAMLICCLELMWILWLCIYYVYADGWVFVCVCVRVCSCARRSIFIFMYRYIDWDTEIILYYALLLCTNNETLIHQHTYQLFVLMEWKSRMYTKLINATCLIYFAILLLLLL